MTVSCEMKQKYDNAVLEYVIKDAHSFKSIYDSGFKELCAALISSSYVPPHPTTLSCRINEKVIVMKNILFDKLNQQNHYSSI